MVYRAIGGRVEQFNHDKELCRKVSVDYTLAAAKRHARKSDFQDA